MKSKSRRLLLAACLFCAVVFAVAAYLNSKPFEAHAMIRVTLPPAGILPTEYASYDRRDVERFRDSIMNEVTDPLVIDSALANPGVANCRTVSDKDSADVWLQRNLSVTAFSDDRICISLSGEYPEDLARIVNAVSHALEEFSNRDRWQKLDELRRFASYHSDRLGKLRLRLSQSENQRREQQSETAFEEELRQRLAVRRVELIEKEARLEYLRSALPENEPESDEVAALRTEVEQLRMVVDQLSASQTRSSAVAAIETEILSREFERERRRLEQIEGQIFTLPKYLNEDEPSQVTVCSPAKIPSRRGRLDRIRRWLGL